MGNKILELSDLITGTVIQEEESTLILTNALISSGIEDYLLPFLWYSRIILFFTKYVKGTWKESFNAMNHVKDELLTHMNEFNKKLMQLVNELFF